MNLFLYLNEQQVGPYTEAEIRNMVATGAVAKTDPCWHEGITDWQPLNTVLAFSQVQRPVRPSIPATPAASAPPTAKGKPVLTCHTCGTGTLAKRKKYRMSMPVVIIGYIFLTPCVIGMMIGVFGLFGSGSGAAVESASVEKKARTHMEAQAVPESVITEVISNKKISQDEETGLSPEQQKAVDEATMSLDSGKVGVGAAAVVAGGVSIFLLISCFVGGLLGWLLVMKKKVLQCNSCGAVVAAS